MNRTLKKGFGPQELHFLSLTIPVTDFATSRFNIAVSSRISVQYEKLHEFIFANKMTNQKRPSNSLTNYLMLPVEILRTVLNK